MPDASVIVLFLSVITVCLVTMTITMVLSARRVRQTLRGIDAILPATDRAIQEVHRSFQQVRQLISKANQASDHVEAIVRQACGTASETLERFRERTQAFWGMRVGNGAGAEPRQHRRRR